MASTKQKTSQNWIISDGFRAWCDSVDVCISVWCLDGDIIQNHVTMDSIDVKHRYQAQISETRLGHLD